ncbi:unnamed protein product [Closterium sp. NIES-65]|nr:unnamed protein product [Closterium sp. NIES-65]
MGVDVDAAPAVEHGVRRGLAAHGRSVSAKEGVIYRSNAHAASLHPRSRAGGMAAAPSAESQAKETKDDGQVNPYGAGGGASLSPGADASKECFDGSDGKGLRATAYDEHSNAMRGGAGAPGGGGGARGAAQAEGMADFRTWLEDQIRFSESLSMMSAAMAGSSSKTAGSVPRTRSATVVSLARLPSLPLSTHAAGSATAAAASPAADGASAPDSALPVSGPLLPPNAVVPLTLGSASGASSAGSGGGGMLLSRFSPLRALARVAARRSRCCFSMHVHGISGLPPAFNRPPSGTPRNGGGGGGGGWEAVVTWQRRGMAVGTSFAEVNEGVVKFEQMLQLSCTLYFSSGPSSTLRFQGKPSTVVVRVLDRTGGGAGGRSAGAGAGGAAEGRIGSSYEIGRHLVDLSRLVPQSLVETEIGPHTLSFPLDGPAKGAVLLATFGYELQINQHSGGGGSGRYGEARVARAETRAFRAFSLPSSARTSPSSSPSRSSGWAGATTATSSSSAAWEARSGGGEWGMEEGQGETPGVEEGPEATSLEREGEVVEGEVGAGEGVVHAGGKGEVEAESAVGKGGGGESGERAESGGEVESVVVREGWGATEGDRVGIEGEGVGRDKEGKGVGVNEEGSLDVSGSSESGRDAVNNESQDDTIMDVIELEDIVAIESSEGAESPFTTRVPAVSSAGAAADSSLSAPHAAPAEGVASDGAGGAEEEEGVGVLEEEMEAVTDEFLALLLDGQLSPERKGGSRSSSSSVKGAGSSGAVSGAAVAGGAVGGGGLVLASSTLSHSGMLTVGNNGLWLDKIPEEEEGESIHCTNLISWLPSPLPVLLSSTVCLRQFPVSLLL